jgi:multidrug efflux pump subunit AcrA (membrane-fusion protein)
VVTAVNVVPGSSANGVAPAIQLLDRSTLHVDLKLSENDVVNVAVRQPVTLTIDSLVGWNVTGTVSYIAPAAETTNGVSTYAIRASFATDDPSVRIGMTANVNITTAHKDDVLLVPNTALLPKGSGHIVQQLGADGKTTNDVDVQLGLSDGANSEIISGLKEGDHFIAFPTQIVPRTGGLFGGSSG